MTSSRASSSVPPPYSAADGLADQMQRINLNDFTTPSEIPTVPQTVAHLKLLFAFQTLRATVSSQDTLFDLNDRDIPQNLDASVREACISKVAEKRWAVFVARAVHRYEIWWQSMKKRIGQPKLTIGDMRPEGPMEKAVRNAPPEKALLEVFSSSSDLPPLDVLMVFHAHCLNPRDFLEDCLRRGMSLLWHRGMPWSFVNAALDEETGMYNPGDEAVKIFESRTGLKWDNLSDPDYIDVSCVICERRGLNGKVRCPWTTTGSFLRADVNYGRTVSNETIQDIMASGKGFADKGLDQPCEACRSAYGQSSTTHESLRALKFSRDIQDLNMAGTNFSKSSFYQCLPLPGTLLSPDGIPQSSIGTKGHEKDANQFPNRLIATIQSLPTSARYYTSITDVRGEIENAFRDKNVLRIVQSTKNRQVFVPRQERMYVRRMMSRYWEVEGPFALDLVGAVVRQGSFIQKMANIDWLHSPAVTSTAQRLIIKYTRFFQIMAKYPAKMAVPTLDVDLAWHTHQLSPASYYAYSLKVNVGKFIDHDDKVSEVALSEAFEHTSEKYQKLYGEPYSQCACWYCEAIRASHTSSASRLFGRTPATADSQLYDPQNPNYADPCTQTDPNRAPHISTHNAIRPEFDARMGNRYQVMLDRTNRKLNSNFEKASKRARKDGRPVPVKARGDSSNVGIGYAYGAAYPYPIIVPYYPYMCDPGINSGSYASNPSCANFAPGSAGNCAAGSCGGAVAAGSCGGAGGGSCAGAGGGACAGAAAGGACSGGGGGGCGGGGGGCGGGGGGCGGGGGGCGGGGGG